MTSEKVSKKGDGSLSDPDVAEVRAPSSCGQVKGVNELASCTSEILIQPRSLLTTMTSAEAAVVTSMVPVNGNNGGV